MTMDWKEFIDLGERLLDRDSSRSAVRTAIGRAYYGAYLSARSFQGALRVGTRVHFASGHTTVPLGFRACSNSRAQIIAERLDELKKLRHRADYVRDDHEVEEEAKATEALAHAREVLSDLEYCRTSLDQDVLRKEMRRVLRGSGPSDEQTSESPTPH